MVVFPRQCWENTLLPLCIAIPSWSGCWRLASHLGNTPDCHLPYVHVKPICALSDSAASFRLVLSTICRIFVLKHSNVGESYETLRDLPYVHNHRRQNPRRRGSR